jgi:uncharacterized protein with PIN domain
MIDALIGGPEFALRYAASLRQPLLWKGDDFGHTGIASALDR